MIVTFLIGERDFPFLSVDDVIEVWLMCCRRVNQWRFVKGEQVVLGRLFTVFKNNTSVALSLCVCLNLYASVILMTKGKFVCSPFIVTVLALEASQLGGFLSFDHFVIRKFIILRRVPVELSFCLLDAVISYHMRSIYRYVHNALSCILRIHCVFSIPCCEW